MKVPSQRPVYPLWLTRLLLPAFLLCLTPTEAPGQNTASNAPSLLRRPAGLEVQDVPLEFALHQLRQGSGVALAFSPDLLASNGPVSCSCRDVTVAVALERLLTGTGLAFVEARNRVILSPEPRSETAIAPPVSAFRWQDGTLLGEVRTVPDSLPIAGAEVQVAGRIGTERTDSEGRFSLRLPVGTYQVTVRALGYAPRRLRNVSVVEGPPQLLTVLLERAPVQLAEIVVTPGTYGILREQGIAPQLTLTREEVQTHPHIGEDIFRAVDRLPGVATDDYTAKFHVRGAPIEQTLVLLDGLELYEPFHLKDADGVLSIIDVESIGDIDLITGGFSVEHGDRMGGVFTMKTVTPTRTQTTLGASIQNFTVKSQGTFATGRGAWLASARRGFLDLIFEITGEDENVAPTYYDAFAKVQYQLGDRHLLSGHVLYAGDAVSSEEDDGTRLESNWSSGYAWASWQADFASNLQAQTLLSGGRITRNRLGSDIDQFDNAQDLQLDDRGAFDFLGLKQDWGWQASSRWLVKWGFDLKRGWADYDYFRWERTLLPNTTDPDLPDVSARFDTARIVANPAGNRAGFYLANRVRPLDPVTAEVGLRYDHHSHTGDNTVAPRANLALQLTSGTVLRGAWGLYYQAHGLPDLQVRDLDDRFYSAQRAEHRVAGLEQRLAPGTSIRMEAYERRISNPRPEFRSLIPILEEVPEEGPEDRVRLEPTRGRARGLEFFLKGTAGRVAWSASYALAAAEDEIAGEWLPHPRDQRHTVQLGFAYQPNPGWSLSWAWQYHSPWPATDMSFALDSVVSGGYFVRTSFGPLYQQRLPAYHRLDARVSRHVPLGPGRLSIFIDVFNVYDRTNAMAFQWDVLQVNARSGRVIVDRYIDDMIGVLPTFGARWEF